MSVLDDPRESSLRGMWADMVARRMPRASARRGWTVDSPECFARILLDAAGRQPWRGTVEAPCWGAAPIEVLEDAAALGEAVMEGSADFVALNRLSAQMRKKLQ